MMPRRALTAAACALALASGGLVACGGEEGQGVDEPAREGLAIELGGVEYNVFITRQINPDVPPDAAYYSGPPVEKGQTLYGVFIQACNKTDEEQESASFFKVKDSLENEFEPETIPGDNPFAYRPKTLKPQECIPEAGSVAQLGPSAASLLLFKLPLEATENRPLELEVEDAALDKLTFELDI